MSNKTLNVMSITTVMSQKTGITVKKMLAVLEEKKIQV